MAPSGRQSREPRYRRKQPDVRRGMLIEAAKACLASDGIQGFTIDRICRRAGVSRGLINHYFDSKDDLLVAVYRGSLYETISTRIAQISDRRSAADSTPDARLAAIIAATFTPDFFSRTNLRVWLALWGEIATNPALRAAHRELYGTYRRTIAREIGSIAEARGIALDADRLALSFLAMVDGLWLEWCLDDTAVAPDETRAAALAMLEAQLGPLGGA
ncbi:MAG: TetR family transcriptional regulator C-terminal domain-containing protein [Paracoccaceae bacterium]